MKYCILCILLLCCSSAFSQNLLKGSITDGSNHPLKGVRVQVKGTQIITQSDSVGGFSIAGDLLYKTIVFDMYGYTGTERNITPVNFSRDMKVVLYPNWHELQEIVVTHSKLHNNTHHESTNLETISPTFIKKYLGGSLMQTLERLAGVKTIGIGSGQSKPLIRGLGFNRVVVLDKGIKHEGQQWGADHGLEIDQFATGEIDILKGAASFIYGSDALGGAIDIKPAPLPAMQTFGGSVDMIGKSNNQLYGTSVALSARTNKLFFSSRYTHQDYADYKVPVEKVYVYDYAIPLYKNTLRNTAGNERSLHFNTGYVSENFRSVFYFSNVFQKSGFFANAHGLEPRRVDAALHDASRRDILMPWQQVDHFKVLNQTHYDFLNHHLQIELAYQNNHRKEFSHYVNHGYMPATYPANATIPKDLEREFKKDVYTFNLRDKYLHGAHEFTFGISGEQQQNEINGWSFLAPAFKQWTAGAYAYDKIRLSELVILHGALRYDHGHIKTKAYRDWFASTITTGNNTVTENLLRADAINRSFNSLVWSVGLNYNPGAFFLKANVGKSFRMPIAKELAANGVNYHYFSYEKGNSSLRPEQSYQLDLGLGYAQGDAWRIELNPFINYFSNYIYLNPTPQYDTYYGAGNQVFEYTQSKVLRFGSEARINYKFFKNFYTEILGEYLFARQLSGNKKGYTLPFSVPPSVLINLTYEPQLHKLLTGSYIAADYRITAAQNNIVPPEKPTPGYGVLNMQAGAKLKTGRQFIDINFQVQNIFDKKYFNHTSFYRLIELPEAGRNFIVNIKIPFIIITKK